MRKLGGIVCDMCRKFIDYGSQEAIEGCVIISFSEKSQKSYGYEFRTYEYCSQACNLKHFEWDRRDSSPDQEFEEVSTT